MESVRHKAACPVCKSKVTRRDVAQDDTMDRITRAFKALQEHSTELKAAVQNGMEEAIPWLQGIEDEMFQSPSKSFSGTAIEMLRNPAQHASPSPATVQKPGGCSHPAIDESMPQLDASCERIQQPQHASPEDLFVRGAGKGIDEIILGLEKVEEPSAVQQSLPKTNRIKAQKETGNASRSRSRSKAKATPASQQPNEDEQGREEARRIPRRLLPWSCAMCTFQNKGNDSKCAMCETPRNATAESHAPTQSLPYCVSEREGNNQTKPKPKANSNTKIKANTQTRQRRLTGGKRKSFPENSEFSESATWKAGKQPWVLLASGLDSDGKAKLATFANIAGATLATDFSPRVTHVVCGTSDRHKEHGGVKRTFKVLMGLLHGCTLVKDQWMDACMKAKRPCEEESFLVTLAEGRAPSSDRGRKNRHSELMKGIEVQLKGDFVDKKQICSLLEAAGATLTTRMPSVGLTIDNPSSHGRGGVILMDCRDKKSLSNVVEQTWYARATGAGVPVIRHSWAMDSIAEIELRPLGSYHL